MSNYNISVDNGLCNRLRSLFSGLKYARENNLKYNVHWPVHPTECPAKFSDLFHPVRYVNFVDTPVEPFVKCNKWIGPRGTQLNHNYDPHEQEWFQDLRPIKTIQDRVDQILKLNLSTAVHIRSGPRYIKMAEIFGCYKPVDQYIDELSNISKFYLATDRPETQQLIESKYPDKITYDKQITNQSTRVAENLSYVQDAVVDLFVCIQTQHFIPSPMSSFSEVVINTHKHDTHRKN